MRNEGYVRSSTRRRGAFAFLRRKQWWYFEGMDPERQLYYVFLAMLALPTSYISMTVIDFGRGLRTTEERFGKVVALPGDRVSVRAEGKWGHLVFDGSKEEGWNIEARTPSIACELTQKALADVHLNRIETRKLDYYVFQFISNETSGRLEFDGTDTAFDGYGYCEHNWGIQPRHSTANWLHFWSPGLAGVVLSCFYDAGVHHHYDYFWTEGKGFYLPSPSQFGFDAAEPLSPWTVKSSAIDLEVKPVYHHLTRMRIPPVLHYLDIDYHQLLVTVKGSAVIGGDRREIEAIGKYDYNRNLW
jgi:hypothetical protein